jgi:hypothetical protein
VFIGDDSSSCCRACSIGRNVEDELEVAGDMGM